MSQHSIEDAIQLFYDILLEKAPEGVIFILFTSYSFLPCHFLLALAISKLDLCEGGSFSTAIFNSDIQLIFSPFRLLYLFVALFKTMYAENLHVVLSSRY